MIVVLRLGHRLKRDKRITTHCGLVARAFGADKIILSGEKDENVISSLKNVVDQWGGPFDIEYRKSWKSVIKEYKARGFKIVHLTMYGIPYEKLLPKLKGNLLVIIGSEKVPAEVYDLTDYNVAIGNQPHSEVAALAVLLRSLLPMPSFSGKIKIVPSERGKRVEKI